MRRTHLALWIVGGAVGWALLFRLTNVPYHFLPERVWVPFCGLIRLGAALWLGARLYRFGDERRSGLLLSFGGLALAGVLELLYEVNVWARPPWETGRVSSLLSYLLVAVLAGLMGLAGGGMARWLERRRKFATSGD